MRPSRVLRVYCTVTFILGLLLCAPMVLMLRANELNAHDAAILTLCWNVLFVMISPLVIDWSERKYFKARFVQLEELAETNPELKAVLDEQCRKLSLPGLRLAAVDTATAEPFSYGLWRQNPRLIVPASWLKPESKPEATNIIPTIETELSRFASRDVSVVFLVFAILQFGIQQGIVTLILHS